MDTLVNRLLEHKDKQPDQIAVLFKKEQLTYGELYTRAAEIASILRAEGIEIGDRVCFSATSKPEMAAVYIAVLMCRAVAVFLDKNATPENMAAIYKEAEARLMLTDKPMKEYVEACHILSLREVYQKTEIQEEQKDSPRERYQGLFETEGYSMPGEEEDAEILFTTGTTGKPKGVVLSYKSVYHIFTNTIQGIGIRNEDRLLLPLPLNHSFALRVLRAVLYQGATVVLQNGFTFAKEVETNIVEHGCTCLAAVPASYEVMKSQMQGEFASVMKNLRYIEFGAGSLNIKQRKEITTLIPNVTIYNTWGSSESGGAIFCNVSEVVKHPTRVGSLGKPLPHVDIRILNPEGQEISSCEMNPGRMTLRGDMQMKGYWKQPELTAQTLVDGWLLTGDMAYLDEDGYVFMLGRADDIINVGGEKVSPIEVEEIAGQYEDVKECACIGVEDPDGVLGQIPMLAMAVKPGFLKDELVKFLSKRMERYKLPQRFLVVDAIPRNKMQKIDRRAVKKLWDENSTLDLMNPVVHAILSRRSIRKFTEQEVPEAILQMILKAGYHAPSGHNLQSWRFTVLTKKEDIEKLKEATMKAAEETKVVVYGFENPKVLVLVSNDTRNPNGCQDASCAAENMMLAAESYGLGSCWLNPLMTLRNVEPVKSMLDEFGIPANHVVWSSVALGYPAAEGSALKKKEKVIYYI